MELAQGSVHFKAKILRHDLLAVRISGRPRVS